MSGLSSLLEKLNALAQTGAELRKSGEIRAGDQVKGIYGFTLKTGIAGEGPHVEPFGNIRPDKSTGNPVVDEVREPVVDIFEEDDHVLIVAEMPGVTAADVKLEVKDDLLTIVASRGRAKYRKEVLLPGSFPRSRISCAANNGIVEVRCMKQ